MPVYPNKPIDLTKQKEITVATFTLDGPIKEFSLNEINIKATDIYSINVQAQTGKVGKHANRLKLIKNNQGLDTVQIFTDKDYTYKELKDTAHINRSTTEENVDRLICFAVVCRNEINELIKLNLGNTSGKDNKDLKKFEANCSSNAKTIFQMKDNKLEDFADKVWEKRRAREEEEKENKKNANKKNSI